MYRECSDDVLWLLGDSYLNYEEFGFSRHGQTIAAPEVLHEVV